MEQERYSDYNNIIPTADLVDVLEWQSKRLVCWSFWWEDRVQGIEQGLSAGIAFLSLNCPALEPLHVATFLKHVVTMPTRDGNKCHRLGVVADLFDVAAYLLNNLIETSLCKKNLFFKCTSSSMKLQEAGVTIVWGKGCNILPHTLYRKPIIRSWPLALPV